jgi:predicted O-linked N-acetylglucosamine transferase (SPINDLY family)
MMSCLVGALDSVTKAIQLNPMLAVAQQTYSSVLAHLSDYRVVIAHSNIALAQAPESSAIWEGRLYTWIYHPDLSTKEIVAEHIRWGERFPMPTEDKFINHQRSAHRRLRVGYVSPDFRGHTCRFYFDPLFSQHDHTKFEFFAYSNVAREDEHTQRFKTYFDTWRNIYGVSDQNVAEMVQCDQIDILVDACGHMLDTRLEVFALKPAPIQVTWLGAAWTTGLKQIDYALFDPYMGPVGTQASETVVQLPRTWAAFRPSEKATKTAVASLPALKNGYITFGYSGRSERLNYKVFHAWAKLLQRLPQARLIMDFKAFFDPLTQAYFQKFMGEHGIDIKRVTLRNSANIFEGLGEIDIVLDSFPHSGGTMLFDALWMGVPTVTLASRPPVGRIGTSLMTNLGLPDWVAQDEEGYINKAVEFASDFERLAELRAGMRERMSASPVMDERGFARDVENAYTVMWQDWCSQVGT